MVGGWASRAGARQGARGAGIWAPAAPCLREQAGDFPVVSPCPYFASDMIVGWAPFTRSGVAERLRVPGGGPLFDGARVGAVAAEPLFESEAVTLFVVLDRCHVGADQGEASPSGQFDSIRGATVGHFVWLESRPLVANPRPEPIGTELEFDVDNFLRIFLVAVPDGVADRLLQRHMNAHELARGPAEFSQVSDQQFQQRLIRVEAAGKLAANGAYRRMR